MRGASMQACRPDPNTTVFERVCAGFSGGPGDKADYLREHIRAKQYDTTTDAVIALREQRRELQDNLHRWNRINRVRPE